MPALAASVTGAMIVALDGTVLIVAQPDLQRDLGASVAQVQWTSTGYLLAVAALLVIAGRLGDRHGHSRLLLIGALGFGATSAGIALASGVGWVIGLRVLQGLFGALLQPATLALLRLAYPADRVNSAIAIRTSAIGVAAAAGPVLGGVLVAQFGWRAVFLINIPVAAVIAVLTATVREVAATQPRTDAISATPAHGRTDTISAAPTHEPTDTTSASAGADAGPPPRPTDASPTSRRADVGTPPRRADGGERPLGFVGPVLLAASLALAVYALVGVPAHSWVAAPTLLGLLAAAGVALLFGVHQRRTEQPLVPSAVARSTPVIASMALLLVVMGGIFGALFTGTFLLQDVLGLDPFDAGLRVLPMTAVMVVGAPLVSVALRRFGARRTAVAGTLLVVLGIAGLSRLGPASTWPAMSIVFAVLGAGFATVMVTATGTVVRDAPPAYAGVVGGLKQTAMNVGPTVGIAVAAGVMAGSAPTVASVAAGSAPAVASVAAGSAPAAASAVAGSASALAGGSATSPTLLVLAGLAALGLVPAALLPGRSAAARMPAAASATSTSVTSTSGHNS
ncbi:LrgA-associated membrane protein LrgB [[Actinomadura] parvosata subsp. kistnae]|nr:LrgA-associated membrane protein LrgB [Actinomadura parvosata subsp. kistnae]